MSASQFDRHPEKLAASGIYRGPRFQSPKLLQESTGHFDVGKTRPLQEKFTVQLTHEVVAGCIRSKAPTDVRSTVYQTSEKLAASGIETRPR